MPESVVGRRIDEVPTPALVLDLPQLESNIAAVADWARGRVQLRPHVKNPKSIDIARRQIAAGAIGVTAATAVEAAAMLEAGIPEVLIASQVVGAAKLDALLAGLDDGSRLLVAVDSVAGVAALDVAARRASLVVGALVEVDVGMRRGGTRSVTETLDVAAAVDAAAGLTLRGVMGYEGHVVLEPDDAARAAGARAAAALLGEHVDALRAAGHEIGVVSAGGTNTHRVTGTLPGVTELQLGTYATMDAGYELYVPGLRCALSVVAQVVAVHGDTVVLDGGVKTFGTAARGLPRPHTPGLVVDRLNDEHLVARADPAPAIGSVHRFDVFAAGPAVLAATRYLVADGDRIVDVWPIIGRSPDAVGRRIADGGAR